MKLYIGCKDDYYDFLATVACAPFEHLSASRFEQMFRCDSH